ncbi:uncharacterized protein PGTG_22349 [Puccinia graminis f. sp. tritici CRL 75-36-700-3]|uniref:Uncharacterized protein n=1 Tax=Puccinia graminis f. sp. tritici (strain CRL 75-36-700-3 / race SCCL) TaxID=418459 RepID=H6QU54_PUCGT|nr:uncharacterized protein PGTG_22349 [Puccinia graminis f. sp. tritici CRL 75-36-700-3]EHS64468.1 hypothetical protein PGTG_22349 [Puccinia graminis f. sp. tritici CRL 75-36-700-3]
MSSAVTPSDSACHPSDAFGRDPRRPPMPEFPAPACVASAPRAFRISAASIPHAPNKPAKALAKARSRHHNGRKRATPNRLETRPSKRNTGPNFTTPPNRCNQAGAMFPGTGTSSDGTNDNDIEVIPISSGTTNTAASAQAIVPNTTLAPASPELEFHSMETYLHVAHVPKEDKVTRGRLLSNGIIHWSFFRSSSEEELRGLGFPIGIARLLIEGAVRLERYDHNMEVYQGGMSPSPIL